MGIPIPPHMNVRKRLFYDIEVSYFIVSAWRLGYKQAVLPHQVIKYPQIICVCWKWEGEDKVHHLTWDEEQSDIKLIKKFIKELDKANQIVAHNGDRYDLKWLRTRAIDNGIMMKPRYETIDTLKIAKAQFNFASNKLDELGKFLKLGKKIQTEYELWDQVCQHKSPEALKQMVTYCEQDVRLLEQVYEKLRPYAKHNFNYGKLYGDDNWSCPECGSLHVRVSKAYTTSMGVRRYYLQCNTKDCATNFPVSNKTYLAMMKWKTENS